MLQLVFKNIQNTDSYTVLEPPATIYFVGIGGIGMSGIAGLLKTMGYRICGSDISENYMTCTLVKMGIKVYIGHDAININDKIDVIVKSGAIHGANPEIIAAERLGLKIITRGQMLAALIKYHNYAINITGAHGKTTTTAMVATIFTAGAQRPTVVNGGIINYYASNFTYGSGKVIITEADESDGSFLKLPTNIGVITNIDLEHMDYYGSFDNMLAAYAQFVKQIKPNGVAIVCADNCNIHKMISVLENTNIITYGIMPENDVTATNIRTVAEGTYFDLNIKNTLQLNHTHNMGLLIPTYGLHNILNALAAITVSLCYGIDVSAIKNGLAKFTGVRRRFTKVGEYNGIIIIDDYAHHPKEIDAVIKSAQLWLQETVSDETNIEIIAVVQPHRYSRLAHLMEEFVEILATSNVSYIIITPVYAANELPIEGVNSQILANNIIQYLRHRHLHSKLSAEKIICVQDLDMLPNIINNIVKGKTLVLCMGAGDITNSATNLATELAKR